MKNKNTTIKINKKTKERLDGLKEFNRETYEEVLRKLLFILNISKKNPERAKKILDKIDRGVKSKRKYTKGYSEELECRLAIKGTRLRRGTKESRGSL